MKLSIKSPPGRGTKEAMALTESLRRAIRSNVTGVSIPATEYATGGTDAEALGQLAMGGRDIRPDDDEATVTGRAYLIEHTRRLSWVRGRRKPITQTEANAIQVGGLKKAITVGRRRLAKRIQSMTNTDGSAAKKVSPAYARWRENKYGVQQDKVFVRSGLLLKSVLSGRLKFHKR